MLRNFGDAGVLSFEETETPEPAAGEVLIKVHNVSVNVTLDIILRKGLYPTKPQLPHVMGTDPVGEVIGIGEGVTNFAPGDRVGVFPSFRSELCVPGQEADDPGIDRFVGVYCWGGYAEFVALPADQVFSIPDNLSYPEATVIVRHLPTARHLIHSKAELKAGEWVLIMGAMGGLASCCVQVAKLLGATVIAAAGADDRVQKSIDHLGADFGINYRTQDLAAEVMKLTKGRGVNVVAESTGDADLWPGAINSLGKTGRLVTAGAHAGGEVSLNLRQLYIRRQRIITGPGANFADALWAMEAAKEGSIRAPIIDRIMPLHEAAEAHRLVEQRIPIGKVLLDPTQSADHPVEN